MRISQEEIKTDDGKGKRKLLCTVTGKESITGTADHGQYRHHNKHALSGIQAHDLIGIVKEDRQVDDFQEIDEDKRFMGKDPGKAMNQIQKRSLLFIDIPISYDTVEHALTDREETVGIIPVIVGVDKR